MSLCRAWRHDVCTEPQDCDCWCHEAHRRRCFELDGARVQGDPEMSPEAREALRQVIAAVQRQMGDEK